jgi:hypothetical protein
VPELKMLGERIGVLRTEVQGLNGEVSASEKEFHDSWSLFQRRIQEIQDLLRGAVDKWTGDRSNLRQRLVDLRDTLHDQLQVAIQSSDGGSGTFWGKITGKPDAGLKMGMEEWERFRIRLETVVQGLEAMLSEIK